MFMSLISLLFFAGTVLFSSAYGSESLPSFSSVCAYAGSLPSLSFVGAHQSTLPSFGSLTSRITQEQRKRQIWQISQATHLPPSSAPPLLLQPVALLLHDQALPSSRASERYSPGIHSPRIRSGGASGTSSLPILAPREFPIAPESIPPLETEPASKKFVVGCATCGKKSFLENPKAFRAHLVLHINGKGPFYCPWMKDGIDTCGKKALNTKNMWLHITKHHLSELPEPAAYKCDVPHCEKSCRSLSALCVHFQAKH